ncbi:MAG TPA: STAS domain-containing protein [Chloroflexi bacterium]|nr:STAS domain-containing protein [Chloroflexota bacterium]
MISQPLRAETRHTPGVAIIALHGDIDGSEEATLQQAYAAATQDNADPVLLNFGGVGYINSTGIALIVGLLARARKEKRPLLACGLSEHYREIFEITRLSDFMQTFPDEHAAVKASTHAG